MSDHDHAEMNLQRSALAPCASALLSSSVLARASAEAASPGATCRLGDASCASRISSGRIVSSAISVSLLVCGPSCVRAEALLVVQLV